MRRGLLLGALALAACGAVGPAEGQPAACARYQRALPDAYGLCVARAAATVPTLAGMQALCANAGSWEAECHAGWVVRQSGNPAADPAALLAACAPSDDCALQQLDARPDPDVLAQVSRCEAYAGAYVNDCVAHATQRWARTWPTGAEVTRVVAGTTPYAVQVGTFVGMVAACAPPSGDRASCPAGEGLLQTACHRAEDAYRAQPSSCGGLLPPPPAP